jgi:hypothetical protein|tara:strand:+ start:165 stop:542 length:378 start_codon:yes stop_codon:yes gene_type:complete
MKSTKNIFVSTTFAKNNSKISDILSICSKANISNIELGSNHIYENNFTKIISDVFNYLSSELMCYNFEELLKKSESLLFNSSSKLKDDINKLNKTLYYVKEKGNIKKKIIMHLENLINESNKNWK